MTDGPIIIDLPLPHRVLHPNGRTRKHGWRAKLVREHRGIACLLAKSKAPKKPWKKAHYDVLFRLPRKQDSDNLLAWLKPYLDGLQDGGIIENDSGLSLRNLFVKSGKKETGNRHEVRLLIWEDDS